MTRDLAVPLMSAAVWATAILALPDLHGAETLVAGTGIEARLTHATGTRISHVADAVQATVVAPIFSGGRLLVPQGATLSGRVESVDRLGLGLKHLTASIEYRFDTLRLPGGPAVPVSARVTQVETAKERVNEQGVVSGIYPTMNLSSSVAYYAVPLLCLEPHFGLPFLGIKVVIARSPDPEIYFPAGTELILRLTSEAVIPELSIPEESLASLSADDKAEINRTLAKLPRQQTDRVRHHPSDLVNIMFLGSRESIDRAFEAAGWSGAQRHSVRTFYRMYHCMVQRMGYTMAPMGNLRLNGVLSDAEYQKSLDTFSKRHHLRLWKQGKQDIWVSAATEDLDYKIRRMHLTHASDPFIDNERAKVVNDLALTGCVDSATLMPRESFEAAADEREQAIRTDGQVAAIRINQCEKPHTVLDSGTPGVHGRRRSVQALVALRNDLILTNPIFLAFNTTRLIRNHQAWPLNASRSPSRAELQNAQAAQSRVQQADWRRPSVLDTTTTVVSER